MTFWLVLAGVAVLVLGIVEGGCRWWVRRRSGYYVWPPRTRLDIRPAPEVFPQLDPRARFDVNADGERGEKAPRNETGLYRILAVGGSAVECFALDQSKTWPSLLERLLNEPPKLKALGARRVHVGNVGHSGVGSAELATILDRILPQYRHLDAILIMVAASDVYHWLEEGAPASRPPPAVPEDMLFGSHPGRRFGWMPSKWAIVEVARRVHRAWFGRFEMKERAGAWYAAARRMRAEAKEIRDTMPDSNVLLRNFDQHFRQAVRLAKAHADRVLILCQPWFQKDYTADEAAHFWHGGVGKPWKENVSVYYSLDVVNRLLALVEAQVIQVSDALGVPHIELRGLLNGGLRHYYDHDHYTPAGAAVVASAVAAALTQKSAPGIREPTAAPSTSGIW
jgi:lysophospholipase L1-like esterase